MHTSEDCESLRKKFEEKIAHKNQLLERERKHSTELRRKVADLERSFAVNPKDKWYLIYLMKELATLESLHERQNHTIEQYRNHFAKFGKFYTEWLEMHKDKINVVEKYE